MMLIDRMTLREIIRITCAILRNHFYYGEEFLKEFLSNFTDDFSIALMEFGDTAGPNVVSDLVSSRRKRFDFTCLFSGRVIRDILIHDFDFNELELQAFENIVSKYSGDQPNEKQSRHKRTYYRKFS